MKQIVHIADSGILQNYRNCHILHFRYFPTECSEDQLDHHGKFSNVFEKQSVRVVWRCTSRLLRPRRHLLSQGHEMKCRRWPSNRCISAEDRESASSISPVHGAHASLGESSGDPCGRAAISWEHPESRLYRIPFLSGAWKHSSSKLWR